LTWKHEFPLKFCSPEQGHMLRTLKAAAPKTFITNKLRTNTPKGSALANMKREALAKRRGTVTARKTPLSVQVLPLIHCPLGLV
jgi:hypothetical protein